MPTRRLLLTGAALSLTACALSGGLPSASAAPSRTLLPYRGEADFRAALEHWRKQAEQRQPARMSEAMGGAMPAPTPPMAMSAAPAPAGKAAADTMKQESITNVQTAGVDEGGIVKHAGNHLVILRRGRLFTVRVGGDQLQPVAAVDAFAPGSSPDGAWYDELLISGSTVVVVGYSYARGGTEIGLFELSPDGSLAWRATHHLRSFDYYSSRNYASRLVGSKLIFYTPTIWQAWGPAPWEQMPSQRRWRGDDVPADWQRILPATRIYRTDDDFPTGEPLALHTVTSCDLRSPQLACESTAVLGPAGRVFYVSENSVYVWTSSWRPSTRGASSAVFRLPLDGSAPTGLKTSGVPVDQLSFLEDGSGHLNVLLRSGGRGEGMWGAESAAQGPMALLRVPLSAFGDGRGSAQAEHYRVLPGPSGWNLQNRFVGDWLLWGGQSNAWALRYAGGDTPQALSPGHAVERIESLGQQALLVGSAGADLHFSAVRLDGRQATPAGRHVQPGVQQGETRTHGFFYRPLNDAQGLLGLPVTSASGWPGRPRGREGSAAVLFLRHGSGSFRPLGQLEARAEAVRDDGCKASCVDWYGNARPIFLGNRIFALLGYELVEGRLEDGLRQEHIEEHRRVNFAPGPRPGERYSPF